MHKPISSRHYPDLQPARRQALRLLAGTALALAAGRDRAKAPEPIRVGSKFDTEGALLGQLIVLLLQQAGYAVQNKVQLGPTQIVRQALLAGEIDVYPEYTGNAAFFFHRENDPAFRQAASAYAQARELDWQHNRLVWLQPAPADNSWAIAVRRDVAQAHGLRSLADFGRWVAGGGRAKLAGSAEFVESEAALPAIQQAYGFQLSAYQLLVLAGGDTSATIKAAMDGSAGVNAAMVYLTDGAISAADLVVLDDPKHVEMVYQPAPVVREDALRRAPGIRQALEPTFRSLTAEALRKLNAQIQLDGLDAASVARGYLQSQGLPSKSAPG